MKNLNQYIQEKFLIDKDFSFPSPKSKGEFKLEILKKIIDKDYDYTNIDVSKLDDLSYLFEDQDITEIDVSDWDVRKVKSVKCMFQNCRYLKSIKGLETWDISNIEDFSFMFAGCTNLKDAGDLSNWEVTKNMNMLCMFSGCKKLNDLGDISQWKSKTPNYDIFPLCNVKIQPIKWAN